MCGRYVSTKTTSDLLDEFDAMDETGGAGTEADFNVAPTTDIRIVVNRVPHDAGKAEGRDQSDGSPPVARVDKNQQAAEGEPVRQLRLARWGLVPSWAKDIGVGNRMFNARAESMTQKSAFTRPFAVRRCLIPADGWYEWQKIDGPDGKPTKQAFLMTPPDGHSLGLAGLYEFWKPKGDEDAEWLVSATILTVPARGPLAEIHPRMPLVLPRTKWARWLDPAKPGPTELLKPSDEVAQEHLELRPVSSRVNSVANNDAELLKRVEPPPAAPELF